MSPTATTSSSLPRRPCSAMARKTRRPMRPNPLMATLTGMCVLCFAVLNKNQAAHRSGGGRCVNDQKKRGAALLGQGALQAGPPAYELCALKAVAESGDKLEVVLQAVWGGTVVVAVLHDEPHVKRLDDRRGNPCLGVEDPVVGVINLRDPLGRLPNPGVALKLVLVALGDASAQVSVLFAADLFEHNGRTGFDRQRRGGFLDEVVTQQRADGKTVVHCCNLVVKPFGAETAVEAVVEQVVILAEAFEVFLGDVGLVVVRRARSGCGFAVAGAGAEEDFIVRPFAFGVQADSGEECFAVAASERDAGRGDGFPTFRRWRGFWGRGIRRGACSGNDGGGEHCHCRPGGSDGEFCHVREFGRCELGSLTRRRVVSEPFAQSPAPREAPGELESPLR